MMEDRAAERSDEHLVAIYVSPDERPATREAAFHDLVERYRRRLFAVCVRVLHDPQDAEEAVQETFVRLARHAETFRGDAKLSTWLYRVARNVCTDHVRYDARRPSTPVADVTEIRDLADEDDGIEGHAAMSEVGRALEQLDERSRQLVLLIAVDGLSYAEAGELTGLAVGTVKSRVSRARQQLGQLLTAEDTESEAMPATSRDQRPATRPSTTAEPRGPPSTS